MHTFWAPGHRRDGLAPLPTLLGSLVETVLLCVAPRLPGLYIGRAGSTSAAQGGGTRKAEEREERKARGRRGKGKQAAADQQGQEGGEGGLGAARPSLNPANRGTGKGAKGTADAG